MVSLELILTFFIVRALLVFVLAGILVNEFFNKERKNKGDLFLILSMILIWIFYVAISEYGFFVKGVSVLLNWISVSLLFLLAGVFFWFAVIKRAKILNRFLMILALFIALMMLISSVVNIQNFFPWLSFFIVILSVVETFVGFFLWVDLLINTSVKRREKRRVKKKNGHKKWMWHVGVVLFLIFMGTTITSSLSVSTHVPEKYTDVVAGDRFYFEIEVKYPENPSRKDLRLSYEILTEQGELVAQSKVLKAVETQASFIDFIVIPESVKSGLHIIKVGISDYEDLSQEVEASFHVVGKREESLQLYFFILLSAIVFVGVFVGIDIFRRRK